MSEIKPIKHFSIEIGQDAFRLYPPMLTFYLNDRFVTLPLKDIRDWFNTIYESKGNRSEESYKAKKNIDQIFHELLNPFMDFSKILKEPPCEK
jgi:hypothetical protein